PCRAHRTPGDGAPRRDWTIGQDAFDIGPLALAGVLPMIHRMDTATDVSTSGTPTGARRGAPRTSVVDSGLARVLHAPASWLVALVGLSTLLRAGLSARVPTPWILADALVSSALAHSTPGA